MAISFQGRDADDNAEKRHFTQENATIWSSIIAGPRQTGQNIASTSAGISAHDSQPASRFRAGDA
jgi:hypothetical protein